jgi:hypothetical protein
MFLWLSEKVKFGQSTVLVGVDETRIPSGGIATIDDGSTRAGTCRRGTQCVVVWEARFGALSATERGFGPCA